MMYNGTKRFRPKPWLVIKGLHHKKIEDIKFTKCKIKYLDIYYKVVLPIKVILPIKDAPSLSLVGSTGFLRDSKFNFPNKSGISK